VKDLLAELISSKTKVDPLSVYRRGLAKTSMLGWKMAKSKKDRLPPQFPILQPLVYVPVSQAFTVDMKKAKESPHLSRYLADSWGEEKVEKEMYSHDNAENYYCTANEPHNFFRYPVYEGPDTVQLRLARVADKVTEARYQEWSEIDPDFFILHQKPFNGQKLSDICDAVRQSGKDVADAWETTMWIEQHCNESGQEYDDRIHALHHFGRKYEKAPTTDGGYVHSQSDVSRVVFYGLSDISEGPGWKAFTRSVLDKDFTVSARDYFLVKE